MKKIIFFVFCIFVIIASFNFIDAQAQIPKIPEKPAEPEPQAVQQAKDLKDSQEGKGVASGSQAAAILVSPAVSIIPASEFDPSKEKLTLYVGQTQFIPINMPTSLRIGNPLIADITRVSEKEIQLTAKHRGQTTFMWNDKYGEYTLLVDVKQEDLSPIKARIDAVLSELGLQDKIKLSINEDEAKIFMTGNLKTEEDKQKLNLGIERLRDKIIDLVTVKEEKPLVEIEVVVYDMNETFTKTIGATWPTAMTIRWPSGGGVVANGIWQRLFDFKEFDRSNLSVTFNFAITEGLGRVLAHPRVVTLSGKEAVINAGGEYPLLEQQGQGITVTYKPYGVVLKIKPTVMDGDKIQTEISAEVSERDNVTTTASYGAGANQVQTFNVTGFTNRNIKTELYMKENDTLVMGGLIHRTETKSTTGLPGLHKLPFFNQLFRNSTNTVTPGRELIILVTPRIIRQQEDKPKIEEPVQLTQQPAPNVIIPQEKYRRVPGELKDYIYDLKTRIFNNASFPAQAQSMGIEGIVNLKVHILRTGQLDNIVMETSSGHAVLDDAALKLVKDLAPYKPFPKDSEYEDIWVDLPLVYHK